MVRVLIISSIGPLKSREVWMLHRICLIAVIVSTLTFMTPAVAHDFGVQGHKGRDTGMSMPMGITCVAVAAG